jgi:hypothetical protein
MNENIILLSLVMGGVVMILAGKLAGRESQKSKTATPEGQGLKTYKPRIQEELGMDEELEEDMEEEELEKQDDELGDEGVPQYIHEGIMYKDYTVQVRQQVEKIEEEKEVQGEVAEEVDEFTERFGPLANRPHEFIGDGPEEQGLPDLEDEDERKREREDAEQEEEANSEEQGGEGDRKRDDAKDDNPKEYKRKMRQRAEQKINEQKRLREIRYYKMYLEQENKSRAEKDKFEQQQIEFNY